MKFIVIDGLDGSGKDTQINLLADMYKKQGKNVVIRSHPCNDNRYGRKSKEALVKTGKFNHIKATIYFGLDTSDAHVCGFFYCFARPDASVGILRDAFGG